jgi:hypothetical protein
MNKVCAALPIPLNMFAVVLEPTILFFYTRRAIMREQTVAALLRDQKM